MEIEIDRKEITREVLAYREMPEGEEKEKEFRRLLKITEELIYIEPVEMGYISEADACGFYLEERRNASKVLSAYSISQLDYPAYIAQIMRVRVRNYILHRQEAESDMRRLHYAERRNSDPCYVMDIDEEYEISGERKMLPAQFRKTASTVKEAFDNILSKTASLKYEDRFMRQKSIRIGLLCMLLSLPKGEGYDYVDHYSELFEIEEDDFITILRLRDDEDVERDERLEKHREVIGKHFKVLLRLGTAYQMTDSQKSRDALNELGIRLEELIEKRCQMMKRECSGYSQREMAALLETSRSTVSNDMRKARNYLVSMMDA